MRKRARNYLRRNPWLVWGLLALRGQGHVMVRPGRSALCIEGYPRSANSSTYRMFMLANPDLHVGHHTHTIANVSLAVRHGVPALVLIRHPVDAICSALIAGKNRSDPTSELLRYVTFYDWVRSHVDDIVVAEFRDVLANWNDAIHRVNDRFGTAFQTHENIAYARKRTEEWIRMRYEAAPSGADITNMPLPSSGRQAEKERWRRLVVSNSLHSEAVEIYEALLPASRSSRGQ